MMRESLHMGLFCISPAAFIEPLELGLAVKIVDGNSRALPPAVLSCLEQLGALSEQVRNDLSWMSPVELHNAGGLIVGHLEALWQ